MPKIFLQGRLSHRARSLVTLAATTAGVLTRRAFGRPVDAAWTWRFEVGTLLVRRQFVHALSRPDIAEGRAYFDSLYTVVDPDPAVDVRPTGAGEPAGCWYLPRGAARDITVLYFHGGGYAFDAAVSRHVIAMLADLLRVRVFAPSYRLTPEHPHPAQLDDAIAAYRWLGEAGVDHRRLAVLGDSAGGHLVLMTLASLASAGLPQPAIGIALSPWTDVGRRGASQFGNDRYDLVQGYQTLRYGEWLRGDTGATRAELSPIDQDFTGVAPLYVQAGGREILVDMIRDFVRSLHDRGAPVRLDVWDHMTHEFHAYGTMLPESREAIGCIAAALDWAVADRDAAPFEAGPHTEVDGLGSVARESPS